MFITTSVTSLLTKAQKLCESAIKKAEKKSQKATDKTIELRKRIKQEEEKLKTASNEMAIAKAMSDKLEAFTKEATKQA